MNITSCIPEQKHSLKGKLDWIEAQLIKEPTDLLITPQEYFGGVQQLLFEQKEPLSYKPEEVVEPIKDLCSKYNTGIIVGVLVQDDSLGQIRERAYLIEPHTGVVGSFDKIFLPAYDHINASGLMRVSPEEDMSLRARTYEICGAKVSVLFCWEVFSNHLWHALRSAEPDFLVNMVKFGIRAWPSKSKDDAGNAIVQGFGYGADGGWQERLHMGSTYDLAAPIVTSTNSWCQPKKAWPLCGVMFPWETDENSSTLWHPYPGESGDIQEVVNTTKIDPLYWRHIRKDKRSMYNAIGEWPDASSRGFTMMMKIKRMEAKLFGGK